MNSICLSIFTDLVFVKSSHALINLVTGNLISSNTLSLKSTNDDDRGVPLFDLMMKFDKNHST